MSGEKLTDAEMTDLFMRSSAWKAFDDMLLKLAVEHEKLRANPNYPGEAGDALAVAMQLYLVEKITADYGKLKGSLEPVIAAFRKADVVAMALANETSGDLN